MKINNYWKEEIEKLNIDYVNALSISIEKSLESANKDAENEIVGFFKNLKNDISLHDFHSKIIQWKTNYLNSKTSDYFILNKYSNDYIKVLEGKESEKISKVALIFFLVFKKSFINDFNKFCEKFSGDFYFYKKSEILYNYSNNIIDFFNNNIDNSIKLPYIDNFEIDVFKASEKLRLEQQNKFSQISEKQKEIFDIKIKNLEESIIDYSEKYKLAVSELFRLKKDLSDVKEDLNYRISENEILTKKYEYIYDYNLKREPVYVHQFDELLWGDNYPALKILYKFLFDFYFIKFNWSFFAYMMTDQSNDVIKLKTNIIKKGQTGYLLFKIKEFFVSNISSDYNRWILKKISIDEQLIDIGFCNKYVRDSEYDYPNQNNIIVIKNLIKDIKDKYYKV